MGEEEAQAGTWNDPPLMVMHNLPKDPWDRDATHGFRLAKTSDSEELAEYPRSPDNPSPVRDERTEEPATD